MSFKTQLRYEQITGSLPNDSLLQTPAGSINAADFGDTLSHLASAIKRIHGGDSFSEQSVGQFHVDMAVTGTLEVSALATLGNGLTVNGAVADFNAGITADQIKIDGATVGNLYIVGSEGELIDTSDIAFDGDKLTINGNFGATDIDASKISIGDDTPGRLYIVGEDGSITDESNLTFDGDLLSVTGDLTITGDLTVQGTTVTLETQNLVVEDNVIIIGHGLNNSANANGGLAIASGSSDGSSLVFGRVANDTFGVGSKDVEDGTVGSLADMTLVNFRAAKFELGSSDGSVLAPEAGHMQLSGSSVSFLTADSDEMTAGYLKLADDGEVATFKAAFGDDTSIIAAINKAANSTTTKLLKVIDSSVSAGNAVSITGLVHDQGSIGPNSLDVYVNGQLMSSGTSNVNNPAGDDYYIHAGTSAAPYNVTPSKGQIVFTFTLQPRDVITVFDKA